MITSPSNEYIKFVRSLKQRKYRDESKRFYIEGGKLIWEALDSGATIERLLFCPELLRGPAEKGIVSRAEGRGIACAEVDRKVFERISDWDDPDGLGAVVVMRRTRFCDVHAAGVPLVALLDSVGDPGNLGTTIRTAEAAGASAVILLGPCVDLHSPKTVRATMGSFFGIPVIQCSDDSEVLDWLRAQGMQIVAGEPGARSVYSEESYLGPTCFVVGNEAHGIRGAILRSSDRSVRIPIAGKADSLNAAVSSAILLYEAVRQRSGGARSTRAEGRRRDDDPPARREEAGRPPFRGSFRTPGARAGGSRRKGESGRPSWTDAVRTDGKRPDTPPLKDAPRPPGENARGGRRNEEPWRPAWKDVSRSPGKRTDRPQRKDEGRPPREKTGGCHRREEAGRPCWKDASSPPGVATDQPQRKDQSYSTGQRERRHRDRQAPADRKRWGGDAAPRRSTRHGGDRT